MQAHDRTHDGQAQAGAAVGTRASAVDPVETLEQPGQVLGRDAGTRVAHRQRHLRGPCADPHVHRRPFRAVANGIGQQVGDGPLHHQAVTLDRCLAGDVEQDALLFGHEGEEFRDLSGFFVQGDLFERNQRGGMADMGQEQHVRHDTRDPAELLGAVLQYQLVLLGRPLSRQRYLRLADEVGDGGAQLVGQVIGELRELLHAAVQAMEHEVDATGQFTKLAGQILQRQAVAQVLSRYAFGDPAELMQRAETAMGYPSGACGDQQQHERQGDQRGFDVGAQQCLIAGAVEGEHGSDACPILAYHQLRGRHPFIAQGVLPALETHGLARTLRQRWQVRQVALAQQDTRLRAIVIQDEREVVVALDQVPDVVDLVAHFGTQGDFAGGMANLLQLVLEVLCRDAVELSAQREVGQGTEQRNQQQTQQGDGKAELARQPGGPHERASST